jgi:hypothetical protein
MNIYFINVLLVSMGKYQMRLRYSETPTFYQNDLAMRNTADPAGSKVIAVLLQTSQSILLLTCQITFTVYKFFNCIKHLHGFFIIIIANTVYSTKSFGQLEL